MFLGELSCLLVYFIANARARSKGKAPDTGKEGFNPLILALPATCDLLATSTMYVGLGLTVSWVAGTAVVGTARAVACVPADAGKPADSAACCRCHLRHPAQDASIFQMLRGSVVVFTGACRRWS